MRKKIHGGDIYTQEYNIDFSANINPLGTPKRVLEAACQGVMQAEHYPDVECMALIHAIAEREQVPEEWIICGNGAAELILALALGRRPKKALLAVPGFAEYEQALLAAGCECDFYECQKEQGFAIQEDFLEYMTEELDLIFLCNPNNPTGLLLDRDFLLRVLKRCEELDVLLVMDECFNGLLEKPEEYSMKAYLNKYPNLFILKAFTKLYAMAGLRLGYGICQDQKLLEQLTAVLQPWNVSIPAQMAGIAALKETVYEEESRSYVTAERKFLKQGLRALGFFCYESAANYIFFEGPAELGARCQEQGIILRDCSNYRGLGDGYWRIAVRTRAENEVLLSVLKEALTKVVP